MHTYSFNDNNAINNALMSLLNYKNLVMPIFRHFLIKLKSFFFRTPNAIFRLGYIYTLYLTIPNNGILSLVR